MSEQEQSIIVQGEDVSAAMAAGLRQLGLSKDDVIVEVLDEGRRAFLGLGGREARVRLTPLGVTGRQETVPQEPVAEMPKDAGTPALESAETVVLPAKPAKEGAPATAATATLPVSAASAGEEWEEQESVAVEIVQELLAKMQVTADLETRMTEPDDVTGRQMLILDVKGNDLGALIGPRGEVLNDLQYIARLMAGHELHRRADFLIDVDGYRQRRQKALAQLAKRMARKAVKRGRPVTLEPMSPYDRRIVHITLRDDDTVRTESTGQGNRRRVRIIPD